MREHPQKRRPERTGLRLLGCAGGISGGFLFIMVGLGLFVSSLPSCDFTFLDRTPRGAHSVHLAVRAAPTTGLVDGTVVEVRSEAFDAGAEVTVGVCLEEADTEHLGVDACDAVHARTFAADSRGDLVAHLRVPRHIEVDHRSRDCASRPGRCLVVAGDASDYDQSGARPITFRRGLRDIDRDADESFVASDRFPAVASPSGPVASGSTLSIVATGFEPGEAIRFGPCTDDFGPNGAFGSCDPPGSLFGTSLALTQWPATKADGAGQVRIEVVVRPWLQVTDVEAWSRGGAPCIGATTTATAATAATTTTAPCGSRRIECAERPGRCSIVVAAAIDSRRSAIVPYELASA